MSDPFAGLSDAERSALKESDPPRRASPMKATLTDRRFSDDGWIFERKLDGERCVAFRRGDDVRLLSRNDKDLNDTYPELVDALADQTTQDFVVDGEIVAFDGAVTSFSRLQERMQIRDADEARRSDVAVWYYLFDLPYLAGHDLSDLPLRTRKRLLHDTLSFEGRLRFTPHRNADGEAYWEEACRKGWEGVIAKRADSPYRRTRSRDWLKFKCVARQELVVGGFTDPRGEREGFGALLVGYHEGDALRYAGKVGTGYDDETLRRLRDRLDEIERETSPFADDVDERDAHFVTPSLVAEVGFTEWTRDGRLRHPRFLGLRDDKAPEDVVRERPES